MTRRRRRPRRVLHVAPARVGGTSDHPQSH